MNVCQLILWLAFAFLYAAAVIAQIDDRRRNLAAQNPGYIYIDCGVDEDYQDDTTGYYYKSDRDFVSTGNNGNITQDTSLKNEQFPRLLSNLRYFPEGRKNCYTLKPEQGKNNYYMIRAYFQYGNYDGNNYPPKFDLYVGVQYWVNIELKPEELTYRSAIYFSPSDFIFVCLVKTSTGVPLISALELRLVNDSIYRTDSGFARRHWVSDVTVPGSNILARYKDDVYDRVWRKDMQIDNTDLLNNTPNLQFQTSDDPYKVPSEVLTTAVKPLNNLSSLSYSVPFYDDLIYYNVYLHFVEVQRTPEGQKREFTITLNGVQHGPYTLQYLKPLTIVYERAQLVGGFVQFSINSTVQSDLPPILNGFEILFAGSTTNLTTSAVDVNAIMGIKQIYNLDIPDWLGDPCQPENLTWNGLNCKYVNNNTYRITSLNLSSSGLHGIIASEFSSLQELESLDLSNNELNGSVPEFLGELPKLANLNLSGNQLINSLPQSLIDKSRNGTLNLSFDHFTNPCSAGSCDKKKRNVLIPIVVSIISFFLLTLVIFAIYWRVKRHRVIESGSGSLVKLKSQRFTYSEIVSMTDNFRKIIGEGGFGKVFLGELNGTRVAVKLLSQSSKQGAKEFLAEVQLLIMVYHRNLVSLKGYCDDHGNMALVYEYMEKGNLRDRLSDRSSDVLPWRERLRIAVDIAHGLEYLHNGCKPPIIHRDLKTANILLSGNLEATTNVPSSENLVAKISDFGISKVFATDGDSHVNTNPAGTFGYIDPEFCSTRQLNKKSDVYSFGIILLELITGRPVAIEGEEYVTPIVQWVSSMIEIGDIQSIVDQRLEGKFNSNSAWKAVEIAISCVPRIGIQRPNMDQVLVELKDCLATEMASERTEWRSSTSTTESNGTLEMSSFSAKQNIQELGPVRHTL